LTSNTFIVSVSGDRSRKTVTVGKETKELMKKIFVEEHLTERDLFWREKGDTWVNSKYTCYVDY
jgi:hypothetical protein